MSLRMPGRTHCTLILTLLPSFFTPTPSILASHCFHYFLPLPFRLESSVALSCIPNLLQSPLRLPSRSSNCPAMKPTNFCLLSFALCIRAAVIKTLSDPPIGIHLRGQERRLDSTLEEVEKRIDYPFFKVRGHRPWNVYQYLFNITVDDYEHSVIFDTGSNKLWVASDNSANYNPTGEWMHARYLSGEKSWGPAAQGSVTLGGVTVTDQIFGVASTGTFAHGTPELGMVGVMGMGRSTHDNITNYFGTCIDHYSTFWSNMRTGLPRQMFSVGIDQLGMMDVWFGSLPPNVAEEQVQWFPLVDAFDGASWDLQFDTITIHHQQLRPSIRKVECSSLSLDTGAAHVLLPWEAAKDIHAGITDVREVDSQDGYIRYQVPCDSILPPISLTTEEGTEMWTRVDGLPILRPTGLCESRVAAHKSRKCLMGHVTYLSNWVVFDDEKHRIGFIPKMASTFLK